MWISQIVTDLNRYSELLVTLRPDQNTLLSNCEDDEGSFFTVHFVPPNEKSLAGRKVAMPIIESLSSASDVPN